MFIVSNPVSWGWHGGTADLVLVLSQPQLSVGEWCTMTMTPLCPSRSSIIWYQ